jgi:two-component system, NarL family, nitrate/nitrite response regulator NarL
MSITTKRGLPRADSRIRRLRPPDSMKPFVGLPDLDRSHDPRHYRNGRQIRLVLADDHPITLTGLKALFGHEPEFLVLECCTDGRAVLNAVMVHRPDVVIVDEDLPPVDGLAVLRRLKGAGHNPRGVLLTARMTDGQRLEAERLGIQAIAPKTIDPQKLVQCVRDVHAGRPALAGERRPGEEPGRISPRVPSAASTVGGLTLRQSEVARAVATGLSNKELAHRLSVSEGTIKNHLHAIYERLQIGGRLALLLYLKERELA